MNASTSEVPENFRRLLEYIKEDKDNFSMQTENFPFPADVSGMISLVSVRPESLHIDWISSQRIGCTIPEYVMGEVRLNIVVVMDKGIEAPMTIRISSGESMDIMRALEKICMNHLAEI